MRVCVVCNIRIIILVQEVSWNKLLAAAPTGCEVSGPWDGAGLAGLSELVKDLRLCSQGLNKLDRQALKQSWETSRSRGRFVDRNSKCLLSADAPSWEGGWETEMCQTAADREALTPNYESWRHEHTTCATKVLFLYESASLASWGCTVKSSKGANCQWHGIHGRPVHMPLFCTPYLCVFVIVLRLFCGQQSVCVVIPPLDTGLYYLIKKKTLKRFMILLLFSVPFFHTFLIDTLWFIWTLNWK